MDNQPLLSNTNDNNYNQTANVGNGRKSHIKVYGATEKPVPVAIPVAVPFENGVPVPAGAPAYPVENPQMAPPPPPVVVVVDEKCPEVKEEGMFEFGCLCVDSQRIEVKLMNSATIDEGRLRASLLQLISTHCCWGKRAAENMRVSEYASIDSYHCQWTVYTEKRWVSPAQRPFHYGVVCSIPAMHTHNAIDR